MRWHGRDLGAGSGAKRSLAVRYVRSLRGFWGPLNGELVYHLHAAPVHGSSSRTGIEDNHLLDSAVPGIVRAPVYEQPFRYVRRTRGRRHAM